MNTDPRLPQVAKTLYQGASRMSKGAAKSPASSVITVCKLFADVLPAVNADDVSEIKIYRAVMRGGQPKRGAQVNFEDDVYMEANDGEALEISPADTDELHLVRVLKAKPGIYFAQAYDQNGLSIPRAGRLVDASSDEELDDDDDSEEGPQAPANDNMNLLMMKEMMGFMRDKDRASHREVPNAVSMATQLAQAITAKEDPGAVAETLREEIRRLNTKFDTDVADIRRKANVEIDEIRGNARRDLDSANDRVRRLEDRYDQDRNSWNNERRSIIDSHANEMRSMRDRFEREISELRAQNLHQAQDFNNKLLGYQTKSNHDILTAERQLMMTDLDKRLAEREVQDANNVIASMQQAAEEQHKQLAAGGGNGGGAVGQLLSFANSPVGEKLFAMMKGDGKPGGGVDMAAVMKALSENPELMKQAQMFFANMGQQQEKQKQEQKQPDPAPQQQPAGSTPVQQPAPTPQPTQNWSQTPPVQEAQKPSFKAVAIVEAADDAEDDDSDEEEIDEEQDQDDDQEE